MNDAAISQCLGPVAVTTVSSSAALMIDWFGLLEYVHTYQDGPTDSGRTRCRMTIRKRYLTKADHLPVKSGCCPKKVGQWVFTRGSGCYKHQTPSPSKARSEHHPATPKARRSCMHAYLSTPHSMSPTAGYTLKHHECVFDIHNVGDEACDRDPQAE